MLILKTLELQNILKHNLQPLIPKFLQSAEKNRNIQIPCLAYLSLPDWGSIILFFALCKCKKKKNIEIRLKQHAQIWKNSNLIISHSKITENRARGPVKKKKRIISQTPSGENFLDLYVNVQKIVEHKSESCKESCSVHKFDEVWQFIDSTQWR